jgi:hypothetical protein
MRSKSIMHGVNVPISPTSTADAKLTNNITISNVAYPGIYENKSDTDPKDPQGTSFRNPYIHTSSTTQEVQEPNVPDSDIKTRDIKTETQTGGDSCSTQSLDSYLLKLYQTILLSDNKKLLANVVLKNSIVLTGEDLEKIIELKTGKKCIINYEDPDAGCCKINSIFMKIASIRIAEENEAVSDFKIRYNRDYLDLITTYQLNLKFVLVN